MTESHPLRPHAAPEDVPEPANAEPEYLVHYDGAYYAGRHLLVDLWEGEGFTDRAHIEAALRAGAEAAEATLLHVHLHRFTENGGVSGVAVLAESHISIHTWPEWDYAAIDIFMCGKTDPGKAAEAIRRAFNPKRHEIADHRRGRVT